MKYHDVQKYLVGKRVHASRPRPRWERQKENQDFTHFELEPGLGLRKEHEHRLIQAICQEDFRDLKLISGFMDGITFPEEITYIRKRISQERKIGFVGKVTDRVLELFHGKTICVMDRDFSTNMIGHVVDVYCDVKEEVHLRNMGNNDENIKYVYGNVYDEQFTIITDIESNRWLNSKIKDWNNVIVIGEI